MSDTIIRVENLSKKYTITHQQEGYSTLRDVLTHKAKTISSKIIKPFANRKTESTREDFWALKDVSFDIKRGDRVGIIGRNGAGKSTLLKILSRIVEPTSGRISINGRVASLLEVGTGFHPELTGRENIYLNGAILGMSKVEINKKFDEIVDFAEVEKFLDTPVKRYSSGMYVRLAFAVAAHLEPEILIVDEVLAVGDAQFQKKCLGKMNDVAEKEGRTVLFVSHQMAAIQNLCQKAIFLNSGKVVLDDKIDTVISSYLRNFVQVSQTSLAERRDRKGTGIIQFVSVILQDETGSCVDFLLSGRSAKLVFSFRNLTNEALKNVHVSLGIDNDLGQRITFFSNEMTKGVFSDIPLESHSIEICIPKLPLTQGRYGFTIYCTVNGVVADWIQNAGFFDVEVGDYYGTGKYQPSGQGNFMIEHNFNLI